MGKSWTPGPWKCGEDRSGTLEIYSASSSYKGNWWKLYYCDESEAARANAALMSLAPEMAALLQRIAASDPGHNQFAALVMGEVREMLERLPK